MNLLSDRHLAHSRSIQADILQKVAIHKRCYLAQSLNVDPTTIGRWLDSSQAGSRLEQFAALLAICELRVVPIQMQCYDHHKIDILFQLAKDSFERFESVDAFLMMSEVEKRGCHE